MEKKYKFTEETKSIYFDRALHRIVAVRDFGCVKAGEKGGWVESESNLSHEGDCWVYDNARVYGNAEVFDNAEVCGDVEVFDNAKVFGNAIVFGKAEVFDNARVYGNAMVFGNARVYGDAQVFGDAKVFGNAEVSGNARIEDIGDYIVFKNWWSSGRFFTWTRSNNRWTVGCFHGTGEELVAKAYSDSETSGREYERVVKYVEAILAEENNKKV